MGAQEPSGDTPDPRGRRRSGPEGRAAAVEGLPDRRHLRTGVITAGHFYGGGEWTFRDLRDPERAVVIRLKDERYARLVTEVEDPPAAVASIRRATWGSDLWLSQGKSNAGHRRERDHP